VKGVIRKIDTKMGVVILAERTYPALYDDQRE